MWFPINLIKEGTSQYVQEVEVHLDYSNDIPDINWDALRARVQ